MNDDEPFEVAGSIRLLSVYVFVTFVYSFRYLRGM